MGEDEKIVEIRKKVLKAELLVSVVDVLSPETGRAVVDVVVDDIDVDGCVAIVAVPAGLCCAAALPATDAAGCIVVLYMLNLPYCRPERLVQGWVSTSP